MENSPERYNNDERPGAENEAFGGRDVPEWLDAIEAQIRNVLDLTEGWNGTHSRPVDRTALEALLDTLGKLEISRDHVPQLVPLSSGGVQAEWHLRDSSIEVGAAPDGRLFAFVVQSGEYALVVENNQQFEDETVQQLAAHLRDLVQD